MTLTRDDPELARPIESEAQLLDFFRQSETPATDWRVGTEHEKIGLYQKTLESVPYEGDRGIAALLSALEREHGFAPLIDEGRLVGLEGDGASITLEPGGQLELSGAPLRTLHETCNEFRSHRSLMAQVSERFGIVWLGLGIHPLAKIEDIPRMPRARYTIMRDFMKQRGTMALDMMHATGSVQVSLDYASEADLARKLRVALAVSPVTTALFASSSISSGEPNGCVSWRARVWRHTDGARCGLLPFVFEDSWGEESAYRCYTEWALDIPMMFIVRDDRHISMQGRSFRDFLAGGRDDLAPILADWNLHLTTLFPEVRLKKVIELRGADSVPPELVCAVPAFWKGLLYDGSALLDVERRVGSWRFKEVDALHAEVARSGLASRTPNGPMLEVARDMVDLAASGLRRMGERNPAGQDETLFLDPLYEVLDSGASPAEHILECWDGAWSRRADLLVEYAKY